MKYDENFEEIENVKIIKCSKISSGKIRKVVEKEFLKKKKE